MLLPVWQVELNVLNECTRLINNSLEFYMYEKETYFHQLWEKLDKNTREECQHFMNRVVEARHQRVLDHQRSKFESLYLQIWSGCSYKGGQSNHAILKTPRPDETNKSNIETDTDTGVRLTSSIPLTEAQEHLFSHGPNFAAVPRCPPKEEYIVAIEHAC